MKTQSKDTSVKAEEFLIGLLRSVSVSKKISKVQSLTSAIMKLSKRAIKRVNPELDEKELNILFVRYNYGNKLAEKFQKFLYEEK